MNTNKYIILSIMITFIFAGCGSLGTTEINPTPKNGDVNKYLKEDQYQRGYSDAISKEREKWIKAGYDDALDVVKRYSKDIASFEAGKYAVKNKFVTYPKLIATNNGGSINLKSLGCEISREMTVDDIFHYYNRNKYTIPVMSQEEVNYTQSNQVFQANLPVQQTQQINTNIVLPTEKQTVNNTNNTNNYVSNKATSAKSYLSLAKNYKSKEMIDKYNLSCTESSTNYSCEFATKAEKDWFCSETKSCK